VLCFLCGGNFIFKYNLDERPIQRVKQFLPILNIDVLRTHIFIGAKNPANLSFNKTRDRHLRKVSVATVVPKTALTRDKVKLYSRLRFGLLDTNNKRVRK
jgi:hypothetical protein